VQRRDCRTPCLADLGKFGKSAALLSKISTTELACLGHDLGRRKHRNRPKLVMLGEKRQASYEY
jgi:hypothetical protein